MTETLCRGLHEKGISVFQPGDIGEIVTNVFIEDPQEEGRENWFGIFKETAAIELRKLKSVGKEPSKAEEPNDENLGL